MREENGSPQVEVVGKPAAEYKGKREAEKRGKGGGSPPRVRIYSLWFDKRSQRL